MNSFAVVNLLTICACVAINLLCVILLIVVSIYKVINKHCVDIIIYRYLPTEPQGPTLKPATIVFKCRETWHSLEWERGFNLSLDAALLLVPFFIMSFAYSLIVTKLWRGMRHEIQHNSNWQNNLTKQNCKNNHIMSTTSMVRSGSEIYCKKCNGKPKCKEDEQKLERDAKSNQSCCVHDMELEFRHVVRSTHIDKSIEAKRKVIRMLFVIIVEFFVCWTPLHVINTIYLFYPDELYLYIGSKGVMSLQLLAYCSSCCNPITYCFMNRKFRLAFLALFKNCRLLRLCSRKNVDAVLPTPPPLSSSQEVTACVIRGSHTRRTELDGLEGEDCV